MIRYERLITPREPFGLLIEPEPATIMAALRGPPPAGDAFILDSTIGQLRASLRARLGLRRPVIASGHQAEFFHAGVLAKSLAADAIARRVGGESLFVSVDSDLPHTRVLRFPVLDTAAPAVSAGAVQQRSLAMPGWRADLPLESQPRAPRQEWEALLGELAGRGRSASADTAIPLIAESVLRSNSDSVDGRDACEQARRTVEQYLGAHTDHEQRVSALCALAEFRAFVAHLALRAGEFAQAYNVAQREYRRAHRVRNAQRPAPLLAIEKGRVELPFWVYRGGALRRRLWVRTDANAVRFFAGDEPLSSGSGDELRHGSFHEQPWLLERAGWRLRPRALALTAFLRLFVADLFIHGIGGAKYDEMTEHFVERFFGAAAAPACCVTATLHPRVPSAAVSLADVAAARAALRDAQHNPQRHASDIPPELLEERQRWIAECVRLRRADRSNRAARAEARRRIRAVNAAILSRVPLIEALAARLAEVGRRWDLACIARDREVFFGLHALDDLSRLNELLRASFVERA